MNVAADNQVSHRGKTLPLTQAKAGGGGRRHRWRAGGAVKVRLGDLADGGVGGGADGIVDPGVLVQCRNIVLVECGAPSTNLSEVGGVAQELAEGGAWKDI